MTLCKHPARFCGSEVYGALSLRRAGTAHGLQVEHRESFTMASWLRGGQMRECLLYTLQYKPCILYFMVDFQGA